MFFSEQGVRNIVLEGSLDTLFCPLGMSGSMIVPLGPGRGPCRKIYSEQTRSGQIFSLCSKKQNGVSSEVKAKPSSFFFDL